MLSYLKKTVQQKKKSKVKGKPFNPNFDGNLLAWYDGDTLATDPANTWGDRSANNFDLTLFNAPTLVNNAINGHDALRFNGINQFAQRLLTPVTNQPYTMYLVFNPITWTINNTILDDGISFTFKYIWMDVASPNIQFYTPAAGLNLNPSFVINNYNILTCIANGLNSVVRTNNNIAVTGNAGVMNGGGLTLSSDITGLARFTNTEFAHLIIRDVADNTATQNLFINYLKNRFAL